MAVQEASTTAALEAADDRIEEANRTADIQALRQAIRDDFTYTGGQGGHISRDEWIERQLTRRSTPEGQAQEARTAERARAAGRGTVLLMTGLRVGAAAEREYEIYGDVGIVNRLYHIQDADGSERCLRFVRVYLNDAGGWRLASHRYIHALD